MLSNVDQNPFCERLVTKCSTELLALLVAIRGQLVSVRIGMRSTKEQDWLLVSLALRAPELLAVFQEHRYRFRNTFRQVFAL